MLLALLFELFQHVSDFVETEKKIRSGCVLAQHKFFGNFCPLAYFATWVLSKGSEHVVYPFSNFW